VGAISSAQDVEAKAIISAASVLFGPRGRPGKDAVRAVSEADGGFMISLDPTSAARPEDGTGGEGVWLELLANGMTFDLTGLAPGPAAERPAMRHSYGLPETIGEQALEAITLRPGPHLAAGGTMLPVVRCLAWVAARLATLPGAVAVSWHPARCWSAPQAFRAGVTRWVEGGVFPAFSLAALAQTADGALQSEGLALFSGQELRIEPDLAEDRASAGKIGLRLLHWLVETGTLAEAQEIAGPDGERLRLEPSANGRFVRVWKG
jgi:hypothetical protein